MYLVYNLTYLPMKLTAELLKKRYKTAEGKGEAREELAEKIAARMKRKK